MNLGNKGQLQTSRYQVLGEQARAERMASSVRSHLPPAWPQHRSAHPRCAWPAPGRWGAGWSESFKSGFEAEPEGRPSGLGSTTFYLSMLEWSSCLGVLSCCTAVL